MLGFGLGLGIQIGVTLGVFEAAQPSGPSVVTGQSYIDWVEYNTRINSISPTPITEEFTPCVYSRYALILDYFDPTYTTYNQKYYSTLFDQYLLRTDRLGAESIISGTSLGNPDAYTCLNRRFVNIMNK